MTSTSIKHDILTRLEGELTGERTAEFVSIGSHKFGFIQLTRQEASLARALVADVSENILQAFADSFVPQMALALQSIDGTSVVEIWPVPEVPRVENPKRYRAEQVMKWLQQQPDSFVTLLWEGYSDIKDKQRERLTKLSEDLNKGEGQVSF